MLHVTTLSLCRKFSLTFDSLNTLVYRMINYPSSDSSLVSYSPAYKSVIGCFSGDWLDVAEIYGEWAVQQRWVKESRMRNRLTPVWLENTALWVWNRGRSENVLQPAVELRKKSWDSLSMSFGIGGIIAPTIIISLNTCLQEKEASRLSTLLNRPAIQAFIHWYI